MHDIFWLAIVPTLALAAGIGVISVWPARGAHEADRDLRSALRRWEDGPRPAARPVGSMNRAEEHAYRRGAFTLAPRVPVEFFPRCDDTGEHASTVMLPRVAHFCPRCEAPDDGPHRELCPFYDPAEAALFAVQFDGLDPVAVRARNLDPEIWRPYLTEREFAESFPGVPYRPAGEVQVPVADVALADQLDQLDRETVDWLSARAAAHADTRARLIVAWQAIWQH